MHFSQILLEDELKKSKIYVFTGKLFFYTLFTLIGLKMVVSFKIILIE